MHELVERMLSGEVAKKGTKYEMKEFFLNFAMHWFNFTYIKTNRHIQNRYYKY